MHNQLNVVVLGYQSWDLGFDSLWSHYDFSLIQIVSSMLPIMSLQEKPLQLETDLLKL